MSGLESISDFVDTGDVVLFSRPCAQFGLRGFIVCSCTKYLHSTEWDHIGVIRKDESGEVELWEATFNGIRHYKLLDRLKKSNAAKIAIRKLNFDFDDELRKKSDEFFDEIKSRPYKSSALQLFRASINIYPIKQARYELFNGIKSEETIAECINFFLRLKQHTIIQEFILRFHKKKVERSLEAAKSYLRKNARSVLENKPDISCLFCSELVAAFYQRVGIFDCSYPSSNEYLPSDFVPGANSSKLNFKNGASLGPMIYLREAAEQNQIGFQTFGSIVAEKLPSKYPMKQAEHVAISVLSGHPLFYGCDYSLMQEMVRSSELITVKKNEEFVPFNSEHKVIPILSVGSVVPTGNSKSTATSLQALNSKSPIPFKTIGNGSEKEKFLCKNNLCIILLVNAYHHMSQIQHSFIQYLIEREVKLKQRKGLFDKNDEFLGKIISPRYYQLKKFFTIFNPSIDASLSLDHFVELDRFMNTKAPEVVVALRLVGADSTSNEISFESFKQLERTANLFRKSDLQLSSFVELLQRKSKDTFSLEINSPKCGLEKSLFGEKGELKCSMDDFTAAMEKRPDFPDELQKFFMCIREEIGQFNDYLKQIIDSDAIENTHEVNSKNELPLLTKLLLISVSGAAARTVVAPLERFKMILQTSPSYIERKSFYIFVRNIIDKEKSVLFSLRSLWRGNTINVARIVPILFVQSLLYQSLLKTEEKIRGKEHNPESDSEVPPFYAAAGNPFEITHMIAGGVAGSLVNVLSTPIEKVRAIYTVSESGESMRVSIRRAAATGSLFRGALPTAAWGFLYIGSSYTIASIFSPLYEHPLSNYDERNVTLMSFKCGLIAGLLGQSIAYPFDTLRRRMQVSTDYQGLNTISSFRKGYCDHGFKGWYRGIVPTVLKYFPSYLCSFGCTYALSKYAESR